MQQCYLNVVIYLIFNNKRVKELATVDKEQSLPVPSACRKLFAEDFLSAFDLDNHNTKRQFFVA